MSLEIIESKTVGKLSAETCEDFIHVSPHYIAVIDGATSVSAACMDKRPGRLIGELIDAEMACIRSGATAQEFFAELNERVSRRLATAMDGSSTECPTASVLVYSAERSEVWVLGDGLAKIGGQFYEFKIPYANAYTLLRCAYLHLLIAEGHAVDQLIDDEADLELVRPFILLQSRIQNRLPPPYGYGAFDGSHGCLDFVRVLPVAPGEEVVLASDGYPALRADLGETEALLVERLCVDPLMIGDYPQVKGRRRGQASFDDRCYVRFRAAS